MRRRILWLLAVVAVSAAPAAAVATTVIAGKAEVDPATDELVVLVGGMTPAGRPARVGEVEVLLDGERLGSPQIGEALAEHAAEASEASAKYKPPIAVGLVYLWTKGVPSAVLDGIHGYFKRLPSRTVVYPTIYGRLRQGRARLPASNISALDEVPYLDGDRPNLGDALRDALREQFGHDTSPLRILLLVTDGRDFADPAGEGPGDFAAIGEELRKSNVHLQIVSYPAPVADAATSAQSLRELQEASGGFHRAVARPEELEPTLESMGQAVADLQRLTFSLPWGAGGTHRVRLRTTVDGRALTIPVGTVTVEGGGAGLWYLLGGVVALLVIAGGAFWFIKRGRPRGPQGSDDRELLDAAHELVRRGVSPSRALAELSRAFRDRVSALATIDPADLGDARYPYFRTRAGRMRLDEIRELLAGSGEEDEGDGAILEVLASTAAGKLNPQDGARTISARASTDVCSRFARMSAGEISALLRRAAKDHPTLATPGARAKVLAVQDEMRSIDPGQISAAWLVRAKGPGRRGETIRLQGSGVVGRGARATVRIDGDPTIADEHAAVSVEGGDYSVVGLAGIVRVEGQETAAPRRLADGDTVELGASRFVFKSASSGALAARRRNTGRSSVS